VRAAKAEDSLRSVHAILLQTLAALDRDSVLEASVLLDDADRAAQQGELGVATLSTAQRLSARVADTLQAHAATSDRLCALEVARAEQRRRRLKKRGQLTLTLGRLNVGDLALFTARFGARSLDNKSDTVVYEAFTRVSGTLPRGSVDDVDFYALANASSSSNSNSNNNNNNSNNSSSGGNNDDEAGPPPRYFLDVQAMAAFGDDVDQRKPLVGEVVCVTDMRGERPPPSLSFLAPDEHFALVLMTKLS